MDLKQLRYFVKIVDARSITAAADALYISQPALSQHMQNLEAALGTRLLDRSASGVVPTSTGATLYRYAVAILRYVADAETSVRAEATAPHGHVAVGMASSTARAIAVPLLRRSSTVLPNIMLELVESPSADLETLVLQGRLDLALTPGGASRRGTNSYALVDENVYVLAHRDLKLPQAGISLEKLAELPLILPSVPNALREQINEVFRSRKLSYKLVAESSSTTVMVSAVSDRLCVTVLPISSVPAHGASDEIAAIPLLDTPIRRRISITSSELAPLSLAAERIRTLIHEVVADEIQSARWKGATCVPRVPAT